MLNLGPCCIEGDGLTHDHSACRRAAFLSKQSVFVVHHAAHQPYTAILHNFSPVILESGEACVFDHQRDLPSYAFPYP